MRFVVVVLALSSGCAAWNVNVKGAEKQNPPDVLVRVDPFAEVSELETRYQAIPVGKVTIHRQWQEKPFYAKRHVMDAMERHVKKKVGSEIASHEVFVVQTTISDARVIDQNATWHGIACGLGFLCPPLWIYNAVAPVENIDRVAAVIQVFRLPATEVARRERTIPGVSNPVVETTGLVATHSEDVELRVEMRRGFLSDFGILGKSVTEREQMIWEPTADALADAIKTAVARAAKKDRPLPPVTTEPPPAPIGDAE
jgi:hypothetical protein